MFTAMYNWGVNPLILEFSYMAQAQIKSLQHEGEPMIEIRGHWDQSALDGLIKAFQKSMGKVGGKLFLRMSELDYMDSAAMGVIMFNMRELARRNAKLVLLQPSPEMRDILRTASLDRILEIRDD